MKTAAPGNAVNFKRLFEPGKIGRLQLKNRLVKAPMATRLATMDGCVTERMVRYYRQLAQGGVGLVIVEFAYVDNLSSKAIDNQLGISSGGHIPGLQWLAANIKENGARAALQIAHCGRQRMSLATPMKAPSPIGWKELLDRGAPPPEELTVAEIKAVVEAFGDAALRAARSDFDMVEIHAAHGYLITEFLAPFTNRRTDQYGGSLENRMRFLMEVMDSVRRKVGPDFPVGVRLLGTDYQENGIVIEETKQVVRALEKAGADAIHVSGGDHDTMDQQVIPEYWPPGYNVWAAEEIKKVAQVPVMASGAIVTPGLAESILEEQKADFISLGRPLVADPYFPIKAQQGMAEDIAPCIRCNNCFLHGIRIGAIACAVNVTVGRGDELDVTPAAVSKKVAVIGGGPAGMQAAVVASLRGHEVTLFERRELGGLLIEASVPDFKADLKRLIDYLAVQVDKAGVTVIGKAASGRTIKDGRFDVAILAVGGVPIVPEVPGIARSIVVGALDVLNGVEVGQRVVVVGGGLVGGETALYLGEMGKNVTIVKRREQLAPELERGARRGFIRRLEMCKPHVQLLTRVRLTEVLDDGVNIVNNDGLSSKLEADTVVLAQGFRPDTIIRDELAGAAGLEVRMAGDCVEPRGVYEAIHEGYLAGLV